MAAPLIGITGRRLQSTVFARMDDRFARTLNDVYFAEFAAAVEAAGGLGVYLPWGKGADQVVDRLDAVVLTGGQDLHPSLWGGDVSVAPPDVDPRLDRNVHDPERDDFELRVLGAARAAGRPVLGICRGLQLINAALGGTLIEHLSSEGEDSHNHTSTAPHDGPAWHEVRFVPGTRLEALYGSSRVTNSWHHQAVDALGDGVRVVAATADGVVEAIEVDDEPVVGVQWHPEWASTPDPIFSWLTAAAIEASSGRSADRGLLRKN